MMSPAILEQQLAECRKENEELRRVIRYLLEDITYPAEQWSEGSSVALARAALAHHAAKVAP